MKLHKMLEKAMKDYPAGSVARFEGVNVDYISNGQFFIYQGSVMGGEDRCQCFYDQGEWAQVVSDGKIAENFECASCERENGVTERTDCQPNVCKKCTTEERKPGLLDGKVAIEISNEREFKLLMQHYESKGWTWCGKDPVLPISELTHTQLSVYNYNTNVMYQDGFLFNVADKADWKIIPFAEFAKEIGIKVPVKSDYKTEEGYNIYDGDTIYFAILAEGKWEKGNGLPFDSNKKHWVFINRPDFAKAFSSVEARDKWIEEANKPKFIDIYRKRNVIGKVSINGFEPNMRISELFSEEIEEIYKASISFHS